MQSRLHKLDNLIKRLVLIAAKGHMPWVSSEDGIEMPKLKCGNSTTLWAIHSDNMPVKCHPFEQNLGGFKELAPYEKSRYEK